MFCFNEFGSVFSDCVVFYGYLHVFKNLLFTLSKFDLVHAAKERKNHEKKLKKNTDMPHSRRLVCVELLSQKQNKIDGLMYSKRGEWKQENKGIGIGREIEM